MSEMRHSDHDRIRDELIEREPADDELTQGGPTDDELAYRDMSGGVEPAGADMDRDDRVETERTDTGRDTAGSAEITELFQPDDIDRFRAGWREVQTRFVDDPREAVEGADRLVADVLQSLNSRFTDRKHELEVRWQQGSEAQTEDLRQALRSYRSFFDRLLNV